MSKPNKPETRSFTWSWAALLLAGFAAFLVAQHSLVFMYHDDWGFAVLDHMAKQKDFSQQSFSTLQFLTFIKDMYLGWSGRALSFGAHILAQRIGLSFVQILQAALIFSYLLLALRLTQAMTNSSLSIFAVAWGILLYLALPESILAGGVYWYSASSSNLWTLSLFLLGAYRVLRDGGISWLTAFIFALSLTFHEQIAVSALAFLITWKFWQWWRCGQSLSQDIARLSAILAAALAVILAPGNFVRRDSGAAFYGDRNALEILSDNILAIGYHLLWPAWDNVFSLLILAATLLLAAWLWLENRITRIEKLAIVSLIPLLAALHAADASTIFAAILMTGFTWYLFRACLEHRNGGLIFSIHIAALASLSLILMAPYFMGRTGIIFLFLEMVPLLFSTWLIQSRLPSVLKVSIIAVSASLAVPAAAKVYDGYAANAPMHRHNDAELRSLAERQRSQPDIAPADQSVRLLKLDDNKYAEVPAHQRRLIQSWIKKYHGIAPDTPFEWLDPQALDLEMSDIPEREPDLVENGFDVYIEKDRLIYAKAECSTEDRQHSFDLVFFSENERDRSPYHFNQSFSFDGVKQQETCLTAKKKPQEPLHMIRTRYHEIRFSRGEVTEIIPIMSSPARDIETHLTSSLRNASLDLLESTGETLSLHGWAFHDSRPAVSGYIRLRSDQNSLTFNVMPNPRPDVQKAFPDLESDEVGFSANISKSDIPPGDYRIQYILRDDSDALFEITFDGSTYKKPD